MNNHNAQIYTSSVAKVTSRLEVYGTGDLADISLLKLCYKYSCYASDYETIQKMDKIVSDLQMKDNDICIDYSNGNFLPSSVSTVIDSTDVTNTAPVVSAGGVNLGPDDQFYTFKLSDFTNGFSDADGHGPGKIVLKGLSSGSLNYDESPAIIGQVIYDPSLLVYDRLQPQSYIDSFLFSIFDDYVDGALESNSASMVINSADATNLPPVVGDNTVYSSNRIITVLTLEMFTSQLAPPYNDPEGDLIDAIRIDEVSQANQGVYALNGVPVIEGDIITREDLSAGLFTHEGADVDTVSSDTLSFSARDEGSLIWVS